MRLSFAILIFCISQIGCSSSYIVSSHPRDADVLTFSELNDEIKDKSATIVFQDSSTLECQSIFSRPDSTSWVNPITGARDAIPTQNIRELFLKSRGRGVFEGIGIGILSGAAVGLLSAGIAVGIGNHSHDDPYLFIGSPIYGGVLGLLTGTIVGVVNGHTYEYEFADHSVKSALYESSKKSSGTAIPLSIILPSAGHAYAHNWGRGLLFAGGRIGGVVLALQGIERGVENVFESGTSNGISFYYRVSNDRTEYTGWFYAGIASAIGLTIWEAIDASAEVDRYNERLYKEIVGVIPLGLNIVPSKNGPQLQFSYAF